VSFHALAREKWRRAPHIAVQTPREAATHRKRKVWQMDVLQSSAAGSDHGEMALSALDKAPFFVSLHRFFDDFLRVFQRPGP
jgi:hypothetical protein